jgi:hydrogenase expression/formation protein HypE
MKTDQILMAHGNGGLLTHELVTQCFSRYFRNAILEPLEDAAILAQHRRRLAFTTDSYVVDPLFFPGGDIGKLAVCGTINDLAVMGATPLYLSCGFILEEGLPLETLERIVQSMARTATSAGVQIVTGDTKVVDRGSAHRMFINTSGIGVCHTRQRLSPQRIRPGDKVLVSGTVGDHGIAILAARKTFELDVPLKSDCAALHELAAAICRASGNVRCMRDPTRGGIATVLNEFVRGRNVGILLSEDQLPVHPAVQQVCDLLGFDPLYIANEGKIVAVVRESDATAVLRAMRRHPLGRRSAIIGEVTDRFPGKVVMETSISGHRIVDMLVSDQFPRIC